MTDSLALIDSCYAAFNSRDWEAYDKHFAADGITRAAGGVEAYGVAALVDFCRRGPPGARVEALELAEEPVEGLEDFAVRY